MTIHVVVLLLFVATSGTLTCIVELTSDDDVSSAVPLNLLVVPVPPTVISPLSAAVALNESLTLRCTVSTEAWSLPSPPTGSRLAGVRWFQDGDVINMRGGEFG